MPFIQIHIYTHMSAHTCTYPHVHPCAWIQVHSLAQRWGRGISNFSLMKWIHDNIVFPSFLAYHQQDLSRDFALDGTGICQMAKVPIPLGCFSFIEVSVSFSVSMYQMDAAFILEKRKKENQVPYPYVYQKSMEGGERERGLSESWLLLPYLLVPENSRVCYCHLQRSLLSESPSSVIKFLSFAMFFNRLFCEIPVHLVMSMGHFNDLCINHSLICSFQGKTSHHPCLE